MTARRWFRIVGVLGLLLVGACASPPPNADLKMSVDTKLNTTASTALRLAPGDKLRVTVFGEDKLSGEYQVDSAGSLSLPLAGTIQGAGLTKPELEQALTTKLKSEYLRNPKVTVDVVSYRPFYVLGEV